MTWVRIDDGFAQHPKVVSAGPLAMAMQVAALCYCNKNLTDGFVPWSVAQTMLSWEYIGEPNERGTPIFKIGVCCGMAGDDATCQTAISQLLLTGMWEEVEGGFRIHDYLDYQPSKAEILALRETKSKAGRAGGRAKHRKSTELDSKHGAKQTASKVLSKNLAQGSGIGNGISTSTEGGVGGNVSFDLSTVDGYFALVAACWHGEMVKRGDSSRLFDPTPDGCQPVAEWCFRRKLPDAKVRAYLRRHAASGGQLRFLPGAADKYDLRDAKQREEWGDDFDDGDGEMND